MLSQIYHSDEEKCILASLLHDISVIIKPDDMMNIAINRDMKIYEAEIRYPFLLHQRISAIIAEEYISNQ